MELLSQLGLAGSYQLHQAPLILTLDERAHQVFVGFCGENWSDLMGVLGRRYPGATPVWGVDEGVEPGFAVLESVREAGILVVPAMRTEHPGGLYGLVWVVDRLLGPGGCPWDIEQTHESLKKYLLEESYELIEAIDRGDSEGMKEELGDVLLQPLMHTQKKQLAEEEWGIEEVVRGITEKLVRRHPHVFEDVSVEGSDEVLRNWDRIKATEKGGAELRRSVLEGVPSAMPALLKAMEVSKRAARCGFEWPDMDSVWEKFEEETREVREAMAGGDKEEVAAELGDLLFTVVNLARWCKVDAEDALRVMVDRFRGRFVRMEELAGRDLRELSAEEWDSLWERAKGELG